MASAVLHLTTIHPLVAQFPMVLLLITPVGLVIWSHLQNRSWYFACVLSASTGAILATLAFATGTSALAHVHDQAIADLILSKHTQYALVTVVLAWVVVALLVGSYPISNYDKQIPSHLRVPYWIRLTTITFSISASIAIALSSRLGILMTWGTM